MNSPPPDTLNDRPLFFRMAAVAYSGMALAAVGIDALAGSGLQSSFDFNGRAMLLGVLAVLPMIPVLFVATGLRDRVVDLLGQTLSECRFVELVLLAVLAGVCEELLFRGALEGWWARLSPLAAMLAVNLLFGLCHALTPTYFVLATAFGLYFSLLARIDGPRNLIPPIIAHTVYDLIGFVLIAREYRRKAKTDHHEHAM